jgi:hypothetical protein
MERREVRELPDSGPWLRYLLALTRAVREVGILLHHYHGSILTDRVNVVVREPIEVGEVTGDALLDLQHDVVYRFFAAGRGRRTRG